MACKFDPLSVETCSCDEPRKNPKGLVTRYEAGLNLQCGVKGIRPLIAMCSVACLE